MVELGSIELGVAIIVTALAVYFTQSWIVNKRKRNLESPQAASSSSSDESNNADDIRRLRLQRFESTTSSPSLSSSSSSSSNISSSYPASTSSSAPASSSSISSSATASSTSSTPSSPLSQKPTPPNPATPPSNSTNPTPTDPPPTTTTPLSPGPAPSTTISPTSISGRKQSSPIPIPNSNGPRASSNRPDLSTSREITSSSSTSSTSSSTFSTADSAYSGPNSLYSGPTSSDSSANKSTTSAKPAKSEAPPPLPTSAIPPSPEVVTHNLICSIFAVTIQPKSKPGVKSFYLPELAHELATTPNPYLTSGMTDSIIVERTVGLSRSETIEYFLVCFKRALRVQAQQEKEKGSSDENIQEIKKCITRYAGLVLGNSFPESAINTKESASLILIPYLEGTSSEEMPVQFLHSICSQLENTDIQNIFGVVFTFLYGKLTVSTLVSNFTPQLKAMITLTSIPSLAEFFVSMKNFIPGTTTNGYTFEQVSPVSALFRFTPMLDTVGQFYFSSPQQMARSSIETSWYSIRLVLQPYHEMLANFSRNLLRSDTRDNYLNWFAALLETNRSRTKMHFDRTAVSSDGLLANMNCVLMTLCEPFTSTATDKWKSIDSNYLVHNTRFQFTNETKLGATDEEVRNYKIKLMEEEEGEKEKEKDKNSSSYNFITESFFLTLYGLHVGIITTGNYYIELNQTLGRILERKKQVQSMGRTQYTELALHQLDQQADALLIMELAIDSVLANPRTVQQTTLFYAFTAEWLLKLLDPDQSGKLVADPPMKFKVIPEFVVEDLMSYVTWLMRVHPDMLTDTVSMEKFVRFAIHLLSSPLSIRNPYLRSKLVGFLAEFVPKENDRNSLRSSNLNLFSLIATHPLAHSHLVPGLISLYIDIEVTGRNSQFYDKLFVRREIALLLKHLRKFNEFITSLKNESKNTAQFVKFLHMLLGDAQYLLDEILIKLKDIRKTIHDMEQPSWNQMDEDMRREREQTHTHTEGQVKTFCVLANETIDLLVFFTSQIKSPFLEGDMAERLANLVNYFLIQLVGKKSLEVKVDNPEKYAWRPRELLVQIIRIYLNLSTMQSFVQAVGGDQRSFKLEYFTKAAETLRTQMMLPENEIKQFEKLVIAAQETAAQLTAQDQEMMNAPEEFIDPLLGVIMENPVILPTSGMTVDRATILRHLMSVPTDPFSRTPLSEDMLSPNTELQAKIDEWKQSKKKS